MILSKFTQVTTEQIEGVIRIKDMNSTNTPAEIMIHLVRGHRVMLDQDLAEIYGVSTTRLNEQVRRNRGRFPSDFVFQLTPLEAKNLMSQFATSSSHWGGRRKPPLVFTEHGAVMLAAVLKSPRAVLASVAIARAFVRLRHMSFGRRELSARLKELEGLVGTHDRDIRTLFDALNGLIDGPTGTTRRIGFQP